MLDKDALSKDIEALSAMVTRIDLAVIIEDDEKLKSALKSASGQLKAGRTWLIKILTGKTVRFHG